MTHHIPNAFDIATYIEAVKSCGESLPPSAHHCVNVTINISGNETSEVKISSVILWSTKTDLYTTGWQEAFASTLENQTLQGGPQE